MVDSQDAPDLNGQERQSEQSPGMVYATNFRTKIHDGMAKIGGRLLTGGYKGTMPEIFRELELDLGTVLADYLGGNDPVAAAAVLINHATDLGKTIRLISKDAKDGVVSPANYGLVGHVLTETMKAVIGGERLYEMAEGVGITCPAEERRFDPTIIDDVKKNLIKWSAGTLETTL